MQLPCKFRTISVYISLISANAVTAKLVEFAMESLVNDHTIPRSTSEPLSSIRWATTSSWCTIAHFGFRLYNLFHTLQLLWLALAPPLGPLSCLATKWRLQEFC